MTGRARLLQPASQIVTPSPAHCILRSIPLVSRSSRAGLATRNNAVTGVNAQDAPLEFGLQLAANAWISCRLPPQTVVLAILSYAIGEGKGQSQGRRHESRSL